MSTLSTSEVHPASGLLGIPGHGLVDAYRVTDFVVKTEVEIALRVDGSVPHLEDWLATQKRESAVVISAWNPFSKSLPSEENIRRNKELLTTIQVTGLLSAPAVGRPRNGKWDPEESFCVFDAPPEVIDAWMQRFEQYAVVLAKKDGTCWLLWHAAFRIAMAEL